MALIKCPECSMEISDQAKACVYCGYPILKPVKQPEVIAHPVECKPEDINAAKKQNKFAFAIAAAVVVFIASFFVSDWISINQAKQRDITKVFWFDFEMTMDDILEHETEVYRHTEYEYDSKNHCLKIGLYHTGYKKHWKHLYHFDPTTGKLISVSYRDLTITMDNSYETECDHIDYLAERLKKLIGEWDKKPTGDSKRYTAYGQIKGVGCRVIYNAYKDEGLFITTKPE